MSSIISMRFIIRVCLRGLIDVTKHRTFRFSFNLQWKRRGGIEQQGRFCPVQTEGFVGVGNNFHIQ